MYPELVKGLGPKAASTLNVDFGAYISAAASLCPGGVCPAGACPAGGEYIGSPPPVAASPSKLTSAWQALAGEARAAAHGGGAAGGEQPTGAPRTR